MNLGKSIECVDVLPYHDLGKGKYKRLGLVYPIEKGIGFKEDYWLRFDLLARKYVVNIHYPSE